MEFFLSLTGRSRPIDKIYDPSALNSFCVSGCSKCIIARSFLGLSTMVSILKCRLFVLIKRCRVRGRFLEYGGALSTSILNLPKVAAWCSAPLIKEQSSTRGKDQRCHPCCPPCQRYSGFSWVVLTPADLPSRFAQAQMYIKPDLWHFSCFWLMRVKSSLGGF